MCGRFHLGFSNKEVQDIVNNLPESDLNVQLRFGDIFPKDVAPVFTAESDKPSLIRWGFERFDKKGVLINARAETVTDRQTFRKGFLERRCAIPVSGFYEWDENKNKKYFVSGDGNLLYLCGFTKPYDGENGFIILTKQSTPPVKKYHNRIPVIADKSAIKKYLTDMSFASEFVTEDNKVKLKSE